MNHRHRKVVHAIFAHPIPANLDFKEVESTLKELGAEIEERAGARVAVTLKGHTVLFHHAHHSVPKDEVEKKKEAAKPAVVRQQPAMHAGPLEGGVGELDEDTHHAPRAYAESPYKGKGRNLAASPSSNVRLLTADFSLHFRLREAQRDVLAGVIAAADADDDVLAPAD